MLIGLLAGGVIIVICAVAGIVSVQREYDRYDRYAHDDGLGVLGTVRTHERRAGRHRNMAFLKFMTKAVFCVLLGGAAALLLTVAIW